MTIKPIIVFPCDVSLFASVTVRITAGLVQRSTRVQFCVAEHERVPNGDRPTRGRQTPGGAGNPGVVLNVDRKPKSIDRNIRVFCVRVRAVLPRNLVFWRPHADRIRARMPYLDHASADGPGCGPGCIGQRFGHLRKPKQHRGTVLVDGKYFRIGVCFVLQTRVMEPNDRL